MRAAAHGSSGLPGLPGARPVRSEPIYLTVILAISSPQEIRRILESCYARHFRRHFRAGYDGARLLEGAPAEGADR